MLRLLWVKLYCSHWDVTTVTTILLLSAGTSAAGDAVCAKWPWSGVSQRGVGWMSVVFVEECNEEVAIATSLPIVRIVRRSFHRCWVRTTAGWKEGRKFLRSHRFNGAERWKKHEARIDSRSQARRSGSTELMSLSPPLNMETKLSEVLSARS